jgi:hypothetical protein
MYLRFWYESLVTLSIYSGVLTSLQGFQVDVLTSDQICGYGNLTINGQELAQEPLEFASIGKGSVHVDGKTVEGSWAFYCLNGFYGPYAQRLDFSVLSVDGKVVDDVTFWVEFKQNDGPRIFSASHLDDDSTLSAVLPDPEVATNEDNGEYNDFIDFENFDIEREIAELKWLKVLVQDFEYQIYLKEEAMAMYLSEENLDACDSLNCVIRTVYSKARVTAYKVITKVYSKLSGHVESEEDMRPPWKKPHGKRPHWGKRPFPPHRHGNHSHGNHTCPGKGNHTHHPFPHHPFPHPHPPPFCRCPPRPPHGHPPHGPPPHGPPPHGPHKGPPGRHPPPPQPHDGPPKGPPGKPPGGPPGRHPVSPGSMLN